MTEATANDAYTIGIALALDDGVSAGIDAIRRDLVALDAAVDVATAKLEHLREVAAEAASLGVRQAGQTASTPLPPASLPAPPPAPLAAPQAEALPSPAAISPRAPVSPAPPPRSAVEPRAPSSSPTASVLLRAAPSAAVPVSSP